MVRQPLMETAKTVPEGFHYLIVLFFFKFICGKGLWGHSLVETGYLLLLPPTQLKTES